MNHMGFVQNTLGGGREAELLTLFFFARMSDGEASASLSRFVPTAVGLSMEEGCGAREGFGTVG